MNFIEACKLLQEEGGLIRLPHMQLIEIHDSDFQYMDGKTFIFSLDGLKPSGVMPFGLDKSMAYRPLGRSDYIMDMDFDISDVQHNTWEHIPEKQPRRFQCPQ